MMKRRAFLKESTMAAAGVAAGVLRVVRPLEAQTPAGSAVAVDPKPLFELSPYLYMQFMEPLGATDGSVEAAWIMHAINGAAGNAERLSRPDVDGRPVDGPGQNAGDAVDRLFVMVVAVRGSRQVLRGRDQELEGCDAASRVVSREQEAHGERSEAEGLIGWIDVEAGCLAGHGRLSC
jgi:hypothetical protein